ncbi:MAG: flagellar motor switch phosphatase FliY [Firmicutes bacterium]|nr:flagellar motor switch phosphatase FliY [Bacillota bacterium]
MSNRLLKQEEIDALLNAQLAESADVLEEGPEDPAQDIPRESTFDSSDEYLSDMEKDALGEVGNICMGSASTTLSMLLNQPVNITSPMVTITTEEKLFESFVIPHMTIYVRFTEGLSGYNFLIIKLEDAAVLADLMMGGDGTNMDEELTEIGISAASEAMNQMIGTASTAMATMFNRTVNISPPETRVYRSDSEDRPNVLGFGPVVVVWFDMKVGDILDTKIMQVMSLETAREEAGLILGQLMPQEAAGAVISEEPLPEAVTERDYAGDFMAGDVSPGFDDGFLESVTTDPALFGAADAAPGGAGGDAGGVRRAQAGIPGAKAPVPPPPPQPAQPKVAAYAPGIDQQRLDLILDIPLKVTVLLGRTRWPMKDILGLTPGSVVELQSLVDEPVEVLVNGTLVAKGEVVVVNENFGVRITNIIGPEERLKYLGS